MKTLSLALPWPPSVNHYYGRSKSGHVYMKNAGRTYRRNVAEMIARLGWPRLAGKVRVDIVAAPPDRRRRDIDNIRKAVYDAISDRRGHKGVIADDAQIVEDSAIMTEPQNIGVVSVTIREIENHREKING